MLDLLNYRKPLPVFRGTPIQRECGACNACCIALEVPEIQKPEAKRCRFAEIRGCSVYQSRPATCRQYRCEWLRGNGGKGDRPDKVGFLVDGRETPMLGVQNIAREIRPGATTSERGRKAMKRFAKDRLCIGYSLKTRQPVSIEGPPMMVTGAKSADPALAEL